MLQRAGGYDLLEIVSFAVQDIQNPGSTRLERPGPVH
jgi:hypothetical protein